MSLADLNHATKAQSSKFQQLNDRFTRGIEEAEKLIVRLEIKASNMADIDPLSQPDASPVKPGDTMLETFAHKADMLALLNQRLLRLAVHLEELI